MNELYDFLADELEAARELHAGRDSEYTRGLVDGLNHALECIAQRLADERYTIAPVSSCLMED